MTGSIPAPAGPLARERKFLSGLPLAETGAWTFEGYASLFGRPDLGNDIVLAGAFAASLKRRGPGGVKLLWQHDPAEPIGVWEEIREDARGLFVRGRLIPDLTRAREARALLKSGALDGLSIGFRTEKARTDPRRGVRELVAVDLWEISLVTFPLLPEARVSAAKAARPDETDALARMIRRGALRLASPGPRTRP